MTPREKVNAWFDKISPKRFAINTKRLQDLHFLVTRYEKYGTVIVEPRDICTGQVRAFVGGVGIAWDSIYKAEEIVPEIFTHKK